MKYNPHYRLHKSVDMRYAKSRRSNNKDKFDQSMRGMNFTMKNMCNPWYVQSGGALANYMIGLVNPFQNNLPLVPWL